MVDELLVRRHLSRNFETEHKRLQNQLLASQLQVHVLSSWSVSSRMHMHCFFNGRNFVTSSFCNDSTPLRPSLSAQARTTPSWERLDAASKSCRTVVSCLCSTFFLIPVSSVLHVCSVFFDGPRRPQDMRRADCDRVTELAGNETNRQRRKVTNMKCSGSQMIQRARTA